MTQPQICQIKTASLFYEALIWGVARGAKTAVVSCPPFLNENLKLTNL